MCITELVGGFIFGKKNPKCINKWWEAPWGTIDLDKPMVLMVHAVDSG